ncbi:ComEC/Rec2 family competence protein, partial [bacterium]|nr:ComEC/Rec2 family competence protein [bacterium]
SFAAVAALIVLTPLVESRLRACWAPDPFLPPSLVPRWRRRLEKPLGRVAQLFGCSVAAWAGLLPLMAWYFHLFTPVSVLANVLVIPLMYAITAAGLLSMVAHPVWPWLALVCNNANWFLVGILVHGVDWLGRLPLAYSFVRAPPLWAVIAFYALLCAVGSGRLVRWRRSLLAAGGVAVTGWAAVAFWTPVRDVELTVLAVDRGSSVFIDLPGVRGDLLVDGSDERSARTEVLPFLRACGVDHLGGLLLTRNNRDHAAGLTFVAGNVAADRAWDSGLGPRSRAHQEWRAMLTGRAVSPVILRAGQTLVPGGGAQLRVLHPPASWSVGRLGVQALVLALEHRDQRVLLLGDCSDAVERALLAGNNDLTAAVIVREAPAAGDCCVPEFLQTVRPRAVVLVTSRRRAIARDIDALAARLAGQGISLYRTDRTGAVVVRMGADRVTVRPWRE